ncbi:MAG TPA: HEAT repeat domain-containing protein [Pyrinomonadaceae bacterium]|nr:HEAT repeat domain-containing protein [Pyrinomonadaceae bacterium]
MGDPGAGKTTLLTALVRNYIKRRKLLPVFVPMGLHKPAESLIPLFDFKDISRGSIETLLNRGEFLVVFDGVNESPCDSIDEVFHEVLAFIKRYPANQYFLSCRTSEFPDWVHEDLTEVTVLPVSMDEVERQFSHTLGASRAREILDRLSLEQGYMRLKELCQNPLLLAMMLSLYKTSQTDDLEILISRARIYEKFLQRLNLRERKKRRPRGLERVWESGFKQEVLGLLGYKMQQTELVYVTDEVLQRWIADALGSGSWDLWWRPEERPTVQVLFRNTVARPPIKGVIKDRQEPRYYAFLHQSFGEYYAALYLKTVIEKDPHRIIDLDYFILDETRRQWEVVTLLCGLLEDSEPVISIIKRKATELKRQSLLVLAGRCVRDATHLSNEDADDIRIRLIDAFKYWDIPFDYDLICAIKETGNRQSPAFPARLAEDALRFTDKYAQVVPVELREASIEALTRFLSAQDPSLIMDAAYTLSKRKYVTEEAKRHVVRVLLEALESSKGHVRQQLIIALKELGHADALPVLLRIIADVAEGPYARAYALNGLGTIGELSAVEPIIDYLLDHENPYRDSASWSLQRLGKIALVRDPKLAERIKKTYLKALLGETNDQEGKYAKGNIVYSLSALNAVEFRDEIIDWIKTQRDPYVVEDGLNAIGVLGGKRAAVTILPFLKSVDPVVRMKAAEALGRLGYVGAIEDLEALIDDGFSIVRDAAQAALQTLRS